MNYKEQIKSPKWQKKRLEVLNLRGFKCEKCGDEEKQLHVHHIFYINGRMIHEYDNDVLQVLCEDCHEKEHNKNTSDHKYDDLIKSIQKYSIKYEEFPLIEMKYIIDSICEDECFYYFLFDLAVAFNSQFANKIAMDLNVYRRLEELEFNFDKHLDNG